MDKGLTWIEIKQGLREAGCPLCNIRDDGTRRNFSFFLDEGVLDPGVRQRLIASGGWCPRHTRLLLTVESRELPDHMGTATIFESLVGAAKHRLDRASKLLPASDTGGARRWRGLVQRFSARLRPPARCPACEAEETREDWLRESFVQTLFDPNLGSEARALYEASEGLCYPHLAGCAEHCATPDQVLELIALEGPKLERLGAELGEYLRKHEAVHREEPLGATIDSWARAARKLAGSEPPGVALERLVETAKRREAR